MRQLTRHRVAHRRRRRSSGTACASASAATSAGANGCALLVADDLVRVFESQEARAHEAADRAVVVPADVGKNVLEGDFGLHAELELLWFPDS